MPEVPLRPAGVAKEEEVEQVKALLVEEMKQAAELSVPLEVDVKTGMNWYEAK